MSQKFCIQMIIDRNRILAAIKHWMHCMHNCWVPNDCVYDFKVSLKVSCNRTSTIFGMASWKIQMVTLQCSFIIELRPVLRFQNGCDNITVMSWKSVSTERQLLLTLHLGKWKGCAAKYSRSGTIGRLSMNKWVRRLIHNDLQMSLNGASTIPDLASWNIKGLWDYIDA